MRAWPWYVSNLALLFALAAMLGFHHVSLQRRVDAIQADRRAETEKVLATMDLIVKNQSVIIGQITTLRQDSQEKALVVPFCDRLYQEFSDLKTHFQRILPIRER